MDSSGILRQTGVISKMRTKAVRYRITGTGRTSLRIFDVQEFGRLALTRFYDPMEDYGLVHDYLDLSEHLPEADLTALLGTPFGPPGAYFDPGRLGSYFQTPQEVVKSLARVQRIDLWYIDEDRRESRPRFKMLLEECAKAGSGLYVTF